MQQAWLKQRLDTFLPPLMRKYGIDLWVVPMREYNEDPVFTAIVAPETFAARRRTIYVFFDKCAAAGTAVSAACIERLALGGIHTRWRVRSAHITARGDRRRRGSRTPGRALGRRAVGAAEDGHRRTQAARHRHQSIHRLRVHRRPLERRARRHVTRARARVDREVQRRRTAAARPHRVAAARRGSVLPEDDRARLGDDADDVLRQGHRPRQDADERSGVVVAPARERSGTRHVVPAERGRAAAGHCAAGGRPDHPAGRRAALRRRHHRRETEYRHAAPRLRPEARRNGRARRAEARARQRERDAGHDDGGDSRRDARATRSFRPCSRA